MRRIGRRAKIFAVVIVYFLTCSTVFLVRYAKDGSGWVVHPANQNVYANGELKEGGTILSADGTELFSLENGYADGETLRKATLHAVGDKSDSINTGVIKTNKAKLIGYDFINGVFQPFEGGTQITLTLDADTCRAAYNALGSRKGTVGVYNYKTGEIICMVSKPSFDPENVPDLSGKAYEGVYVNRLTGGVYTPGSVFKLVTAAAAIDTIPNLYSRTFTCKGGTTIGGEWIKCSGNHGNVDFATALAHSCNAAFAELSVEIGKETLAEYAAKSGVGKQFSINGVDTSMGKFRVENAAAAELAWAGIGQYTDLVNPMGYMIYMGAVANGGRAVTPYYIKEIKTAYGLPQYFHFPSKEGRMLSEETAASLKSLMRNAVKVEYGESGFSGMELCAKTGTAEVDDGAPHAWFTGFLDREDTPLAFVVVVENGGSGKGTALPVARTVLQTALKAFE